jgi:Co/Zn/Cd efflux system component
LNANGRADALGMASDAGGVVAGPGLWSAEIATRAGNYVTYGYWSATRAGTR